MLSSKAKTEHFHSRQEEIRAERPSERRMGLPTKARKAGKGASVITVNKDDFFHYTNFRILDSIGYPGAYRKFMLKRKEQGADWAVRMNEHVLSVQHSIKDLSILEQVGLARLCCAVY